MKRKRVQFRNFQMRKFKKKNALSSRNLSNTKNNKNFIYNSECRRRLISQPPNSKFCRNNFLIYRSQPIQLMFFWVDVSEFTLPVNFPQNNSFGPSVRIFRELPINARKISRKKTTHSTLTDKIWELDWKIRLIRIQTT